MRATPALLLSILLLTSTVHAQTTAWDPLFLGFGSEPEMDYGGRTVMSLHSLLSRSIGRIGHVGERLPGVASA